MKGFDERIIGMRLAHIPPYRQWHKARAFPECWTDWAAICPLLSRPDRRASQYLIALIITSPAVSDSYLCVFLFSFCFASVASASASG